ncbi:MAG: hypothetical protein ABSA96_09905 [Candidatus Acidiferrales bacterium]|jgi:hypothetical protein
MHEDVRVAAIRKSLVGRVLPQEDLGRNATLRVAVGFPVAQNESQGRS